MNEITANAAAVARIAPENLKAVSIKPVKPIFGAKPQKPIFILHTTDNRIVGKSIFYLEVPEIPGLCLQQADVKQQRYKYQDDFLQANQDK